jgi:ribosomal protein S18 acetylase RimI-like enzyme
MGKNNIVIRHAVETDAEKVWVLMKELAVFEHYIDAFAITPDIIKDKGFRKTPSDFHCIVADDNGEIAGMLVYYFLPFTAMNRPNLFMKELYVESEYRGFKIGEKLMEELVKIGKLNNCGSIKWGVAPWNEGGIRFYERLGAKLDNEWINYKLDISENE